MRQTLQRAGAAALITLAVAAAAAPVQAQGDALRWIEPYTGQRVAVDPATQHVFVLGDNGSVTMLGARTGARLQQVTVPGVGAWGAGVVDDRIGRAIYLAS